MKILYITSSLPSLTLTFVYREIAALEAGGVVVDVVTMHRPNEKLVSDEASHLLDTTVFLNAVPFTRLVFQAAVTAIRKPGRTARALRRLISARPVSGPRDVLRLAYHFIQGAYVAGRIVQPSHSHIHAHFVSGPSSIAMFAATFSKTPYSLTMHGSQIYVDPIGLRTKLRSCEFAVSISEFHRRYVTETYGRAVGSKEIHVIRCGLDMSRFEDVEERSTWSNPLRVLSVCRLVEVKGMEYLIRSCGRLLERGIPFELKIVGDGPLRNDLEALGRELGVSEFVRFEGAKLQSEVMQYYRWANVFCLPCVVDRNGSQDGLPVVLMEAMAWKLPVVSSRLVGIPELVRNQETGLLVEPRDVDGLADALERANSEQEMALELGRNGRRFVSKHFNVLSEAEKLKACFAASARSIDSNN